MPGGEIVPVGDKEKAPSALAIGLADQQKLYAQRYEELDDEISDGVTETVPTDRLKHMFSDEPNWMVDGITVQLNDEDGLLSVYREDLDIFTRTASKMETPKPKSLDEQVKVGWTGSLAAQRGYKAGMRIAKWAGNRRRKASLGLHFYQEWFFMALGACVAVLLLALGLLIAAGADGVQLGIASALFALAPPITFGGAMIVTSRNLDAKALGLLAFVFLGVVPMVPLLTGWGHCGFKMSGARCLGNAANGALWTIAVVCPAAAVSWGFIHRVWHGSKTNPRVSMAIATATCVFVMLPLGAFLPIAAFDAWVSWDFFWKGDAMYAACMVSFTTMHAIFYRLLYANFLLEHYDPLAEETPSDDAQIKADAEAEAGAGVDAGKGGSTISDATALVDPKAEAKKRRHRTRLMYQLSFVFLFMANAVMTQSFLSMLNTRHDIDADIGKRNMLIVVSVFSVFVVPAGVFVVRGDFVSLNARLTGAIWLGMVLPQMAGFYLGTFDKGDQEALRAFLLRVAPAFTLLLCTYATLISFVKREVLLYYGGMTNFWIVAFCLFFIFPALGIFVSRHIDEYNRTERAAADYGLLLAAVAPFLYLAAYTGRTLLRAYRERALLRLVKSVVESGAPTAAMSTLITHVIFGVSMGIFSNVLHNYSHPTGGRGMCIALLVNGPLFFHVGPRFYAWSSARPGARRSWFRSAVYWIVFLFIPLAAFVVYNHTPWGNDARYAALFCGFLTPGGALMWLVLSGIPGVLNALQLPDVKPARVFPVALSFLCLFCVFPFGVFAPATVASSAYTTRAEKLADPIDFTTFASENSWAMFLPTLLTMYGGFLAMVTVTVFAVTLNARMDRLQEELKMKARTIKVRRKLRAIQVKVVVPIAKFVVNEVEKLPREEAVLKLIESEWVTWKKLTGNSRELVLADGAKLDLGEEEEEGADGKGAEAMLPEVMYTPETRLLVLESATFSELTKVLPETMPAGTFQVLDAEEENAIREARQAELKQDGTMRFPDEVEQFAHTVRIAQMIITLKLGGAIPHLFTKRLKARCLDELCAALAECVGVPRERVYVQQVVTHPDVVVTMILVEHPGGRAAAALNAAVANPKRNTKTLDALKAVLAKNVTLGGGADITPVRSEINVEFVRVRRVKLHEGMYIGMHRFGEHAEEDAELDRLKEKKKKKMGGFMSIFSGFTGGDVEDTLAEDEEREEQRRQARWQRRKERKMTAMMRYAQREGRKNAISNAFVHRNKQAAPSRDEMEGLTRSAPAVVRRIVALGAFGGGPKSKAGGSQGDGTPTSDPLRNKALWGGALQTLKDKEVLTFEDNLSFGIGGHSSTMAHGDFYLDVLPKIFCTYSHEVEIDLEDSDDEDNIATTVPGDDDGITRIMNMIEFRKLVGDLFPNGVSSLHGTDVEWRKNRDQNPDSASAHASYAPSVRSVADMAFLDAVLKAGTNVRKLNYRLFCSAIPTIGSQAMPRVKFGERQQAMRMRFMRVADKYNMVSGGLGGLFKHKVKVDLTKFLNPDKHKAKSAPVMARAADYQSDDELPAVPEAEGGAEAAGVDRGDDGKTTKKAAGLLKSVFMFMPKTRFEGEDDDDGDDFFDEEFDESSDDDDDEDTADGGETTDGGTSDAADDSSEDYVSSEDYEDADVGEDEDGDDDDDVDGTFGLSDSRPIPAHSHISLFEDDPDIAMLKETREKLAKLKALEEERKKEELNVFKDQALSIERKQEELRVEQIQEMIANHALAKKKEKLSQGGVPLPPAQPAAPAESVSRSGRPRKKKGATSPDASSPELSPRGGSAGPPPPPRGAPSGRKKKGTISPDASSPELSPRGGPAGPSPPSRGAPSGRKTKGAISPELSSPELSPRGGPAGPSPPPPAAPSGPTPPAAPSGPKPPAAPSGPKPPAAPSGPKPPAAPSGPKPPARPKRNRKASQAGGVSLTPPQANVPAVEQPPPTTSPGSASEPGPVTEQFDTTSGAVVSADDSVREQKAKKQAAKEKRRKKSEQTRAAGADGGAHTGTGDDDATKKKKKKNANKSFKAAAAAAAAGGGGGGGGSDGKSKKPEVPKRKKKKRDKSGVRDPEWDWEHCVGEIVGAIDSVKDGTEIDEVEDGTFSYTSGANIIVMVTVFTETITHTLFAFSPKLLMYWGVPPTAPAADSGEYAMLAPPKPAFVWHMTFAVSFFLALFYFAIALPAIKLAQSGKLGMGKDGKKARAGSPQWFYAQALNVLGGALYVMLLRNMFSVLICSEENVQCAPCEAQFYMCESATLPGLNYGSAQNATFLPSVNSSTGMVSGMAEWLDGYVYAPPGGVDGMVNASRAAGGCRELFNGCYDAHVVGGLCEEFDGRSHVLMADEPRIPCWGLVHAGYLTALILAVITYYPISTFLFPNFQFADISLDIKYDAGFLVILNQAKLILAGVSSYYGKQIEGVTTSPSIERLSAYSSLFIQITVFGFLCYYNYTSSPCLLKWFNIFRTVSFATSFVACCASLVMVLAWDISWEGADVVPEEVTWAARGVGFTVLIGGWIAVAVGARLSHVQGTRKRLQEKARKATLFKAAVQRTVVKAAMAGALHKAAGLGSLRHGTEAEEEGQGQALTDERAAEVAAKMETVTIKTLAMLAAGADNGTRRMSDKLEEAKEGVTAITKTFRNAVLKRQMAKISAASAFGKAGGGGGAAGGEAVTAATDGEESQGLLSLRERAAAAAKGKEPEETGESTFSDSVVGSSSSPS